MNKNQVQSTRSFLRRYWYVSIFVLFFILLLLSQILRLITPPSPITDNTYNGVTPGRTKMKDLEGLLGVAQRSETTQVGLVQYYESDYPTLPNVVVTDPAGTVQFIKEYVPYNPELKLEQYIQEHGQPDLELIDPEWGESTRAHVFLSQGLVIFAHIADGTVEQRWYFTPTSKTHFLETWGANLTDQGSGPEPFQLPLGYEDVE